MDLHGLLQGYLYLLYLLAQIKMRIEASRDRANRRASRVEARTDAYRAAHGGTFTFLHAISKRPLLDAQTSCRDAERQDDGTSRLCCDTIGSDGLRIT